MNNNSELSNTLHKFANNCKKPKNKVCNISHLFIYGNNEKCFLSNKLVCYYTKGCFFFMCLVRLLLMVNSWLHLLHWYDFSVLWMTSCLSRACLVPKHFWQLWHLYFSLWIFSCNRNLIPLLNFDPQDGHTCSPQFSWWYLLSACRLKTFRHFSHVGFGWVRKIQSISSRWLCASLFHS